MRRKGRRVSIRIKAEGPAWDAIGEAIGHLPKKFVANELRNALKKCGSIANKDLKPRIPTRTKKLRKSVGVKSDKYANGNSYVIVGFRKAMGVGKYQYPAIRGSGNRFTNAGRYTGKAPKVNPDPFEATTKSIAKRVRIELYAAADKSIEKGTKRYPHMMKTY